MNRRLLAALGAGIAVAGTLGCSSDVHDGQGPAGGAVGVAAAGNPSVGGGANAGSGGLSEGGDCVEQPSPLRTQGTLLSLPLELVLSNQPFIFGQPNALADGGSLIALNLRFYVSQVQLQRSSGGPIAVDLLTTSGVPEPYGVHLFNAEEADTAALRVLAPAGDYTGISFALGIKLACNQQPPAGLSEPLTDVSQMTWPHTGGFLFLRYEGLYSAANGDTSGASVTIPPAVHMGGDISQERVPSVSVSGAFSVPASGTFEKGLKVVMDEVFKGATADLDVSDVAVGLLSTPESIAGERLRRELPQLHVFVLEP